VIPLQIIYSFHDQEREEGASALSFFGSRTPSFLKIAENRKATTPFSLRSTEIFLKPQSCSEAKVAKVRKRPLRYLCNLVAFWGLQCVG
jgi:hypothetical protein